MNEDIVVSREFAYSFGKIMDAGSKRCPSCDAAIEKAAVSRYKASIRKQVEALRDGAEKNIQSKGEKYAKHWEVAELSYQHVLDLIDGKEEHDGLNETE